MALLDTIPGVNRQVAEVMLAEMGLDMSQFPTGQRKMQLWIGRFVKRCHLLQYLVASYLKTTRQAQALYSEDRWPS